MQSLSLCPTSSHLLPPNFPYPCAPLACFWCTEEARRAAQVAVAEGASTLQQDDQLVSPEYINDDGSAAALHGFDPQRGDGATRPRSEVARPVCQRCHRLRSDACATTWDGPSARHGRARGQESGEKTGRGEVGLICIRTFIRGRHARGLHACARSQSSPPLTSNVSSLALLPRVPVIPPLFAKRRTL